MFKNLNAILGNEGLGAEDLANILGIHRNTLANKLSGGSEFTLKEAETIRLVFKKKYAFDYLFARHSEAS